MGIGKALGLFLGAACALLGLASALLFAGAGRGVPAAPAVSEAPAAELPRIDPDAARMLDDPSAYAAVAERPLFNDTRQPEPDDGGLVVENTEETGGPEGPGEPASPLEVAVKGIIIGPDIKLAIVTDSKANSTLRLREGMPLEGEQAAWTLAEIKPRGLVFDGVGSERTEIELQVNTKALAGGPKVKNRTPPPAAQPAAEQADDDSQAAGGEEIDPEARAEEIRRRVAERRAQLREEAARRRAERAAGNDDDDN